MLRTPAQCIPVLGIARTFSLCCNRCLNCEQVDRRSSPSWYLDPLVAKQKGEVHGELIRRWCAGRNLSRILKTDLFEEAFGADDVLIHIEDVISQPVFGLDTAFGTVDRARQRYREQGLHFLAADVRTLPFRAGSFDLVFSNSTLDHFDSVEEVHQSLAELARVLRPGGMLIVTLDNPWNPLYPVLRWYSKRSWAPFKLGCTLSRRALNSSLENCGLDVTANEWLIHNPRLISTALFLILRRIMGDRADWTIRTLLKFFGFLGRTPARGFTACFVAAVARKPG